MDYGDLCSRFEYHKPKDEATAQKLNLVRNLCFDLAEELNEIVPDGREKSLAITHLEEVMFWANAGIAREIKE